MNTTYYKFIHPIDNGWRICRRIVIIGQIWELQDIFNLQSYRIDITRIIVTKLEPRND